MTLCSVKSITIVVQRLVCLAEERGLLREQHSNPTIAQGFVQLVCFLA